LGAVPNLDEIRSQRFAYLLAVYEAADGGEGRFVSSTEIQESLGFDEELADKVTAYLRGEGLLDWAAFAAIKLTHRGVKEVEQALGAPAEPTEHFPAVVVAQNYINVGSMSHSQIQQDSPGSSQTLGTADLAVLRELILEISSAALNLGLGEDDARDLKADLATIEAQLSSSRPKHGILREALASTRAILEGASAAGVASAAPHVPQLVERIVQALAALRL